MSNINSPTLVLHPQSDAQQDWLWSWIENSSPFKFHIDLQITFRQRPKIREDVFIQAGEKKRIANFSFDTINDYPQYHCKITKYTTIGHEKPYEIIIKTKPAHYVKSQVFIESVQTYGRVFQLLPPKKKVAFVKSKSTNTAPWIGEEFKALNFDEFAHFDPVIDLHIEKLVDNPKSIKPNHILEFKLQILSEFIEDGYKAGVDEVFVVHGIGAGKLKMHVHDLLSVHPNVKSFENKYDARFGFGATTVKFK